jgi:hypothetical protein
MDNHANKVIRPRTISIHGDPSDSARYRSKSGNGFHATYIIGGTVAPQGPGAARNCCCVIPFTVSVGICTGFADGTLAGVLAFSLTFATSGTRNLRAHAFPCCGLRTTARIKGPRSLLRRLLHGGR